MSHYVVVGAGPVGRETARLLAEQGHSVILTSRNAGSIDVGPVRTVSSDATDAAQLAGFTKGADAIFMCAMAAYHRWPTDFFPIMDGTVKAAEQVGAKLIVAGNVYGYGAGAVSPLTPELEPDPTSRKGTTRHIMWQRALRSNVPAIEVRASDYLGKGAVTYFSLLALPSLLKNEPVSFLGDLDAPHAWSFTGDTARTLVAASRYTGEWGRAFHVPSQSVSVRELVQKFADALKIDAPNLRRLTSADLESSGFGEAVEMSYLFEKPLLLDADDTEKRLGVTASSLDMMVRDTLS
ncbi:NAD(P)H-binding protein [Bradyrhizobium guangzhouense]|uniref:NAD-dependent epimerase/dehydratase family protein n=1 Tax=Bradyrhizobium guangzhouense TaxID=1325095 RepID=A0AAE6C5G1_9BRAD|nr:NAD(P)H-binding protein [Bradyrhizobium guangzhouense]QAU43914.1 oxidoreductase [Bradyrhizobium guangzhouense]RXH18005.1 NAD-dependent epimerase/dehydratase family protein [Bradyrhizobium guangzhouense]